MTEQFSPIEIKCGYCDKVAAQRVVARYDAIVSQEYDEITGTVDVGDEWILRLSVCHSCQRVNYSVADDADYDATVIYPQPKISDTSVLPPAVAKAYAAARAVRFVNTNAFAVMLGRLLETVCIDCGAVGDTLNLQLKDLSDKGRLPGSLADMASQLRSLRNVGAHAASGELTHSEIPILDELCETILEYIYVSPSRVATIAKHIEELKRRNMNT